jgi:hypothetical protein
MVNPLKFQAEIKVIISGTFEFHSTRNGIRVTAREIADYSVIMCHLDARNLSYYTYNPESLEPGNAMIRHLPGETPAKDISNELVTLSFSVISVRQMTASKPQSQGSSQITNLSLFQVTSVRKEKSPEICKLNSLSRVVVRVEAYRAQTGLIHVITAKSSDMSGPTVSSPLDVYDVEAATSTKNVPKMAKNHQYQITATASWVKGKNLDPLTTAAATTRSRNFCGGRRRKPQQRTRLEECSL